ncbi:hypothetical protein [Nocardioides speluncae]|uniref:hypothetical protein n=1 Tax=Nocardioides speluncae TaxID=2670337 RepID=UPI000D6A02A8|nr:hypothetical protein [Nocardioides speluncae]
MAERKPDKSGVAIYLVVLVIIAFLVVVAGLSDADGDTGDEPDLTPAPSRSQSPSQSPSATASPEPTEPAEPTSESAEPEAAPGEPAGLPHGAQRIFDGRMLVAYYGTAGTGVLGVLGEAAPETSYQRLVRAAAPFARDGKEPLPVFELIVTVADAAPGKDGDYNHDIDRGLVKKYVEAAHRHGVLLVLDIQPGRANFADVARRWKWALEDPWVGLALDPEWRMGRREVPGRTVGSVSAAEINQTSAWLADLTAAYDLPEKILMLHQFRTSMIRGIDQVVRRDRLVMVQHTDGFGTPRQKLDTYRAVRRPDRFYQGFKLFYDEDIRRMSARDVLRIRPRIDFVSFQ